jgi:GPN-loop GTPase
MPTVICYIIDTVRCSNPNTFMSNILYALSIMYKTRLPMVLVFNKTDIVNHQFAVEWLQDFDKFDESLQEHKTYLSSLSRSMGLVLEEFYTSLNACGVSAVTGIGMDSFITSIERATQEYYETFLPDLENRRNENLKEKSKLIQENEKKFDADHKDNIGSIHPENTEVDIEALYNESVDTLIETLKM